MTADSFKAYINRQVELTEAYVINRGFSTGDPIVCRGLTDEAMGRAVVRELSSRFNAEVRVEPESSEVGHFVVIGTKDKADNEFIRGRIAALQKILRPGK